MFQQLSDLETKFNEKKLLAETDQRKGVLRTKIQQLFAIGEGDFPVSVVNFQNESKYELILHLNANELRVPPYSNCPYSEKYQLSNISILNNNQNKYQIFLQFSIHADNENEKQNEQEKKKKK